MLLILLVIVADILLGVTEDLVVIPVCSLVFDLVLGGLYVEVSVGFDVSNKLVGVGSSTGDRISPFDVSNKLVGVGSSTGDRISPCS